jgi:hypothetical protein
MQIDEEENGKHVVIDEVEKQFSMTMRKTYFSAE